MSVTLRPYRGGGWEVDITTLEVFAPRFVDGHAPPNRHKPSGINSIESILKWHLIPTLGPKHRQHVVHGLWCALPAAEV